MDSEDYIIYLCLSTIYTYIYKLKKNDHEFKAWDGLGRKEKEGNYVIILIFKIKK